MVLLPGLLGGNLAPFPGGGNRRGPLCPSEDQGISLACPWWEGWEWVGGGTCPCLAPGNTLLCAWRTGHVRNSCHLSVCLLPPSPGPSAKHTSGFSPLSEMWWLVIQLIYGTKISSLCALSVIIWIDEGISLFLPMDACRIIESWFCILDLTAMDLDISFFRFRITSELCIQRFVKNLS